MPGEDDMQNFFFFLCVCYFIGEQESFKMSYDLFKTIEPLFLFFVPDVTFVTDVNRQRHEQMD